MYILPIREDVEACEDVKPLVLSEPTLSKIIVGCMGGKEYEILVISEEESKKYLLSLD
jgi:hypothetical protein